jgi:hypothetical protein
VGLKGLQAKALADHDFAVILAIVARRSPWRQTEQSARLAD